MMETEGEREKRARPTSRWRDLLRGQRKKCVLRSETSASLSPWHSHSLSPFFLSQILSISYSPSFYRSPGERQIGHLITHDPLGNAVAGKRGERGGGVNQTKRREGRGRKDASKIGPPILIFCPPLSIFPSFATSIGHLFFSELLRCPPPSHVLFSSISLRWRLCLCICDIKSTAVPRLLARVSPAHAHLKIKWLYIYAGQIIGLSFGPV